MSDRVPVAAQTLPVCPFRKNVAMSSGTRTALIFRSTAGAELVRGTGQAGEIRGEMRRHCLDRAGRPGRMAALADPGHVSSLFCPQQPQRSRRPSMASISATRALADRN